MKTILRNITLVAAIISISSCNKLDLNVNPVQPVTVPAKQRLPGIEANLAYSFYSQARFSAYHSYYFTTRAGNSNSITDTWNYNSITRMGAWRWHYFDVGSNVNGMIIRAVEDKSNNYVGVGKIILAASYLSATDVFGDMPLKQAYSGSFNPLYDTQEEVFAGIDKLLNEGVAELDNVNELAQSMDGTADLIYNGNLESWKAFAKAIRARMKLRTANFQNGNQELLTIVNDALVQFQDALFRYPKPTTTGWTSNLWGPTLPPPAGEAFQFADIKNDMVNTLPTDVLMKALTVDATTNPVIYDPRLFKLTTPGINKKYLGAKMSEGLRDASLPTNTTYQDFAIVSNGYWTSDGSPFPIMIKEELYFIKAETLFYLNQLDEALTAYHAGIELNLRRLGVEEGQIISYMGSTKVAQNTGSLKISNIMMQKYLALYLQPETWSDMRRYGYNVKAYPDVKYPRYALAEWGGKYIQRFPYDPQTEYVFNPKEIERLGAKVRNWVFTPVWWADNSKLKFDE
ncbi:SusD/RagB family nutrient-binding outer membrane lipoprotein [Pedobacter sp. ASV1-7]|uniref:SusD/RagB family nutrient-binding outer membrane lipoprotein n=1 Tax=Pedobacter sp. ASV1-7 TaxID=3145237 RepID=UPI0032E883EE